MERRVCTSVSMVNTSAWCQTYRNVVPDCWTGGVAEQATQHPLDPAATLPGHGAGTPAKVSATLLRRPVEPKAVHGRFLRFA